MKVYDFAVKIFNQIIIFFRSLFSKRVETSASNISTELPLPPQSLRPSSPNEEPLRAKENNEARRPVATTRQPLVYDSFFSKYLGNL